MEYSEQALNEQERFALDNEPSHIEQFKQEEPTAEPISFTQPEENPSEPIAALKKDLNKQRSEYKKLLLSYTELSNAFRTHLSRSLNDFFIATVNDLKSDKEKLALENKFFIEQLYSILNENYALKASSTGNQTGLDLRSFEDLLFQNFYMKNSLKVFFGEKIEWLETQLKDSNNVIKNQEHVIKELKAEVDGYRAGPEGVNTMQSKGEEVMKRLKVTEAILDEVRKENTRMRREIIEREGRERMLSFEAVRLREEINRTSQDIKVIEKQKGILEVENKYLHEICDEFDKISVGHILKYSESQVYEQLKSTVDENFELKKEITHLRNEISRIIQEHDHEEQIFNVEKAKFAAESERFSIASTKFQSDSSKFAIERARFEAETLAHHSQLKHLSTSSSASASKKDEELRTLKDSIQLATEKCEALESTVESLKKDLADSLKNSKKVSDELEIVKKITSKKVSQLETALSLKSAELSKQSLEGIPLEKLIMLIHKILPKINLGSY